MRVSVVVINWNRLALLQTCLASLRACGEPLELIVVDNGSTDGSIEFLKSQADVVLVANERNEGYAPANNRGMALARGDYVLLLNNDTRVTRGFLDPMLALMEADATIGGCQAKMLTYGEPPRIDAYGSYLTWSGFLYHRLYGKPDPPPEPAFEIFAAKGAAFLIRRSVLLAVGGFDPDFFAYMEDSDLSWRIWLHGSRLLCVPESIVFHMGAATASSLPTEFITFHSFKNRIAMLLMNLSGPAMLRMLPPHLLINLALIPVFLLRADGAHARGLARAMAWNVRHLSVTLRKRRHVQRQLRRVPDRLLLPRILRRVRPSFYYYMLTGLERYRDDPPAGV